MQKSGYKIGILRRGMPRARCFLGLTWTLSGGMCHYTMVNATTASKSLVMDDDGVFCIVAFLSCCFSLPFPPSSLFEEYLLKQT